MSGKVLDVGCGDMPYKKLFPDCEWVGIDSRPVGDLVADPHQMGIVEDESFDTVLCLDVLHNCASPLMVMKECARVLKTGGKLIVTVPNTYYEDGVSFWRITKNGMQYLTHATGNLRGLILHVDGRAISHEWAEQFGSLHEDVKGWLSKIDDKYPQVTFAVMEKVEPEEGVTDG